MRSLSSQESYRTWPKWMLFSVFLLTVPVPYYMVVVGGIVPPFYLVYHVVRGLIIALPKFTAEGFFILGILWTHVAILGGLLYLISAGITRVLFRALPVRFALGVVLALSVTLFVAATFTIYRVPGHNSAPPADIFHFLKILHA
jgi:hypothetical protein